MLKIIFKNEANYERQKPEFKWLFTHALPTVSFYAYIINNGSVY